MTNRLALTMTGAFYEAWSILKQSKMDQAMAMLAQVQAAKRARGAAEQGQQPQLQEYRYPQDEKTDAAMQAFNQVQQNKLNNIMAQQGQQQGGQVQQQVPPMMNLPPVNQPAQQQPAPFSTQAFGQTMQDRGLMSQMQ